MTDAIFYRWIACLTLAVLAGGCQGVPHRDQGALIGGVGGAGLGAAIGRKTGNPVAGAVLGAAAGTLTGAAIGESIDAQQAATAAIASRAGRPVSFSQVIQMTRAGLSDDVIVAHIEANGVERRPTADDLVKLKNDGVSDRVLLAMQQNARPRAAEQPVIIERHHYVEPWDWWCWPPGWHHHHPPASRPGIRWGISFYN
ncbi:MAG: hypothetical protein KatS3mg110_4271 [Pirellulaceae bacterium]|nr:MAG: hypothetical protein KatS3mg110_4271 [Pirellulaceae bacterium]